MCCAERSRGRGQAGIQADQGAPVGLIHPVRRLIGRLAGQRLQFVADADQEGRYRQFRAQRMHFIQVEIEDGGGLAHQRMLHRAGVDVRVAVAVAADPAAHLHEGRQFAVDRMALRELGRDLGLDVFVQAWEFAQEGDAVIGQRVLDFVGNGELGIAQHPGLPQRRHPGVQQLGVARKFPRRQRQVALGQQAGDFTLRIENALALHFGGVRGEHRRNQGLLEEAAYCRARNAGIIQP